jgi:glutaredoxin 3
MNNNPTLDSLILPGKITLFSKTWCPYCDESKDTFKRIGVNYDLLELDKNPLSDKDIQRLNTICGFKTVPKIFIGTNCIGGNAELQIYYKSGELKDLLKDEGISYTKY